MTNVSSYNIEWRNKSGELQGYLTPYVSSVFWTWNQKGGCGQAQVIINMPYRKFEFRAMDDIQIRVADLDNGGTKLAYRGWVMAVTPRLKTPQQIVLHVRGYFDLLRFIVVQDSGAEMTYSGYYIHEIVENIANTFISEKSVITVGTIDESTFSADQLDFHTSVQDSLRTLADLQGNIEYGVDENREFFWREKDDTVRKKYIVGADIEVLSRKVDYSRLVNEIYFEGGKVAGTPFRTSAANTDSQYAYFVAEDIVVNSSITTTSVAAQYLSALLADKATPKYLMRVKIPNTSFRFEDTVPMGKVSIYDNEYDADSVTAGLWGTTANGGSNWKWGRTDNGGRGAIWGGGGGGYQDYVESIRYQPSGDAGKFDIEISLGGTRDETAAKLKQLDLLASNIRQRG
jgi:hypothetical protein